MKKTTLRSTLRLHLGLALLLGAGIAGAATERFTVIMGGKNVGHLVAESSGSQVAIDFDFKNNGRGPTIREALTLGADGMPTAWTVDGATTFGSKVHESFTQEAGKASWQDATGKGSAAGPGPHMYVAQNGSPWAYGLYSRALLKSGQDRLGVLPSGALTLSKVATVEVKGKAGAQRVTAYEVGGIDLTPTTILLDGDNQLFAEVSPRMIVVREGFEAEEERLRDLAAQWATQRLMAIQKQVAHRYDAPVRIRNVRLFDPATMALSGPVAVVVRGRLIAAVEPADSPATPGEVAIDGAGGTLVPGMFEMHGHLQQDGGLLDIAAGITSVRDMGNDNAVLDKLIERIESGVIGGPRVVRSGFIEGKSPFNANMGIVVDNQQKAVDAVRWYAANGYWQIKIYNSMNPAWVPAMVAEAHRLGLRVAGHVPAFSTADQMMEAGYDEMTHINQFMLQWVLGPKDDTRTLVRLTALKKLPSVDLNSARVQHSIDMIAGRKLAMDPTVGIHENLLLNRDGQVPPGAVDYFDHMPIGYQRMAMKQWSDTSAPGDDQAYRGAFEKIMATVRLLNERGVFIVPGTDTGGSFTYHRELELYQRAGMTPAEIVKRASYDMARYTGQDQRLGSITKGKLADFFLIPGDPTRDLKAIKTISMVVKDGAVYFPSEIYPHFGIRPFVAAPAVAMPPARAD
jgi:imidazolonepropionase-like amidohydrolase